MEQWQIEEIEKILATEIKEVEPGERVYTSSPVYGTSRYHLLDNVGNGVQIEQVEVSEKWGKRIVLDSGEIPAVLKALLGWYLDTVREERERGAPDRSDDFSIDDGDIFP